MKDMGKARRILERISAGCEDQGICDDGVIIVSRKGVPYLWLQHHRLDISVCYFAGSKCLKIWTGCGTPENKYITTVKEWPFAIVVVKNIIKKNSPTL